MKFAWNKTHPISKVASFLKYVGPGLLITVGFIDPGNWASNIAAGSQYGYTLLWMVTLSTVMLIVLQHNAAHLGIVTGKCLSEAATAYMRPWLKNIVLLTAMGASVSTALAEILGAAIALNMLFHLPIKLGAVLVLTVVLALQFTNSYKKIEKIIIGFVSLIGLSFLFEILIIKTDWGRGGGRVGYPRVSPRLHAGDHERAGGGGHAAQPVFAQRDHPEPPVELAGREGDPSAAEVRVCGHALFDDRRLGHQQRDDFNGGRDVFSQRHGRDRSGAGQGDAHAVAG